MATADRVLESALGLFGANGYAVTTMEQVRREASVSNGSLYHVFPHKAALAAHLYCDGMIQCQDGVVDALRDAATAEEGVRGAVAFQAGWVDRHVELARLVYADLPDEVHVAAAPSLDARARGYVRTVDQWLRAQIDLGAVIDQPFAVLHALWLGPTQEFCRHWLRGRSRLRPRHVAAELGDGAWRALDAS
jgi:AcrR family transcriptional regulator